MDNLLVLLDGLWWISFVSVCGFGLLALIALIDSTSRDDD